MLMQGNSRQRLKSASGKKIAHHGMLEHMVNEVYVRRFPVDTDVDTQFGHRGRTGPAERSRSIGKEKK